MNKCLWNLCKSHCEPEVWKILAAMGSTFKSHCKSCFCLFFPLTITFLLTSWCIYLASPAWRDLFLQVFSPILLWVPPALQPRGKAARNRHRVTDLGVSSMTVWDFIFHVKLAWLENYFSGDSSSIDISSAPSSIAASPLHCACSGYTTCSLQLFKSPPSAREVVKSLTCTCAEDLVQFLKGVTA